MRKLYTLLLYLAVPFIMLRLLWRSRQITGYRHRWNERFGRYDFPALERSIWLHTVSVGEFMAALPMLKQIRQRYPDLPLVVTTTTPTGSEQVIKHFGQDVVHVYTPYDLPKIVKRFLRHMNPVAAVIMETELWPNLLHEVHKKNIPLMLANARLSAKSAKGYQRIGGLTAQMLRCFSVIAVQCAADGQRFVDLGLPKERLDVAGNIKFDLKVPDDILDRGQQLRTEWSAQQRRVLVVASTHEGEEEHVLDVFKRLKQKGGYDDVLMVLVPRHLDRFDRVHTMCQQAGFSVARRSKNQTVDASTDIVLGDTMGEMLLFFASSDLAFIAGSIVPIGGHNLIEAAVLGVPVFTGHYLHNFIAVRDLLTQADAVLISHNDDEFLQNTCQLLDSAELRQQMGQRGREVIMANKGALERHLQWVDRLIAS